MPTPWKKTAYNKVRFLTSVNEEAGEKDPVFPPLHMLKTAQETVKAVKFLSEQRLKELADSGYMPCYRVDGSEPVFVIAEVRNYVSATLIRGQSGIPFPRALPVLVDAKACERMPPPQLQRIRALYWLPKDAYPPCVYFLIKNGAVVYVGQTTKIFTRLDSHNREKDFDDVFYLPVPVSELLEVESAFIRALSPPLNEDVVSNAISCSVVQHKRDLALLSRAGFDVSRQWQNVGKVLMASIAPTEKVVADVVDLARNAENDAIQQM